MKGLYSIFRRVFSRKLVLGNLINIFGLSLGISLFVLITVYVRQEKSVDKWNPNYGQVYRICTYSDEGTGTGTVARLAEIVRDGVPQIESTLRIDPFGSNNVVRYQDRIMNIGKVTMADSTLFHFFPFSLVSGDPETCLRLPLSIVISQSRARELFGNEPALGKQILFRGEHWVQITGVMKDLDHSTHLEGDAFLSFHTYPVLRNNPGLFDSFGMYNYETYVFLSPRVDVTDVQTKLNAFQDRYAEENNLADWGENNYRFQNLQEVYFEPQIRSNFRKGNPQEVRILFLISWIILVLALINYVNLATAQSSTRLRALAIRKASGASRLALIWSIMQEALLVSFLSVNVGLVMLEIIRPLFSSLFGVDLSIGYMDKLWFFPSVFGGGILLGLIGGLYPSVYVTGFRGNTPMDAHIRKGRSEAGIRKGLSIVQIFTAVVFVFSTVTVFWQLHYIKNKDLGFTKDELLYISLNSDLRGKRELLYEEISRHTAVKSLSFSYASYRLSNERWGFDYEGEDIFNHIEVGDTAYLKTLGYRLREGRDFSPSDPDGTVIINEAAQRKYFGEDAVGKTVTSVGENAEIIGVVQDYNFQSLHSPVEPLMILKMPAWANILNIRFDTRETASLIRHIEKIWEELSPNFPFQYHFVDEMYERKYEKEKQAGVLFLILAFAAVLIACLGIFGLATFSARQRAHEVGVRKVNGSSEGQIIQMLTLEVTRLALFGAIPALLLAWYLMNRWLAGFAYHTHIPWWSVPVTLLLVWGVAWLTTLTRAISTARINPAEVLRQE